MRCLVALFIAAILFCLPTKGLAHNNYTFRKSSTASKPHFFVIDTSIIALDPILSCGSGSQVRLLAGVAQTYQWVRNGIAIPGATNRQFTASISGAYRVRVGDGLGNLDSSRIIDVLIVPYPSTSFTVNQVAQCLVGNSFQFTNSTTISQGTATYTWYYGDGSYQLSTNGSHSYSTAGTYSVKLVATSNYGCVDSARLTVATQLPPNVDFSINSQAQCLNSNQFFFTNNSSVQSGSLTFRWDFGDGGGSTATQPAYTYNNAGNYVVKLIATTNGGCRDSVARATIVHPKPIVFYTVNSNEQCRQGNYFQFTNNSSVSSGSNSYFWDFGDGFISGITSPFHSYSNPGVYPVSLLAVSNNGCRDSITMNMTVRPSPIALFSVNTITQCFIDHQYNFNNQSTVSSGAIQYYWEFGDGLGTSSIQNPSYRYQNPGTYRVTLRATTNFNCVADYSLNLYLNPTPTGYIQTPTDTIICEGSFIRLQASPAQYYQWYLNNQLISGATASTYNATQPGVYKVLLQNNFGCSSLSSNSVTLTKTFKPSADFIFDRTCAKYSTSFTNLSSFQNSLPVLFNWNFGDSIQSSLISPSHTYFSAGSYLVELSVKPINCPHLQHSIIKTILIQEGPSNLRNPSVNAIAGKDIQLQSRTFSGATYRWSPANGLSNSSIANPIYNGASEQEYLINITTQAGCPVVDTLLVRSFPEREIYVPDYFTPNGDGKNDILFPFLVGVTHFKSFRVWNKWGELVFQTSTSGIGWDGIFRGVAQPLGSYLWIAEGLDIYGKPIQRNGTVLLIR